MNGISMVEKIKEVPEFSELPMFMLTTETTDTLKQKGEELGIKAWIVKPFIEEKLKKAVKKVGRKKRR